MFAEAGMPAVEECSLKCLKWRGFPPFSPRIGIGLTVALTVLLGTAARQRVGVLLLCFLAGPLVFSNLYLLHDYYFYATGVFLLAAAVIAFVWTRRSQLKNIFTRG